MSFRPWMMVALLGSALGTTTIASGCGGDEMCTPGKQEACPCAGGELGFQSCNADGSGFDACTCGGGGSTGQGAGPSAGGGPASSSQSSSSSASAGGMGTGGMPGTGGVGPGGGGPMCDGTGQCEDSDPDPTNDCFSCAVERRCKAEGDACGASPECLLYNQCIQGCGTPPDAACKTSCDMQQPVGSAIYSAAADCFCYVCPTDCADSFCTF